MVIIVSEETGTISTALDGKLTSNYSYQSLSKFLEAELLTEEKEETGRKQLRNRLRRGASKAKDAESAETADEDKSNS